MTPAQKIKRELLLEAKESGDEDLQFDEEITPENLEELYDRVMYETDAYCDYEEGFREGEVETGIQSEYSRHYESKSVARKLRDGTWIGWTYWYGGGKHGEPGAVEWMEDAYELDCKEEEKLVLVREFTKKSAEEPMK
jgi:hypothetical protein